MSFDLDIQAMNEVQLRDAIRLLQRDNPGVELDVSDDVLHLRQTLQAARDQLLIFAAEAANAADSSAQRALPGPTSTPKIVLPSITSLTDQTGSKRVWSDEKLMDKNLSHPLTAYCSSRLNHVGERYDGIMEDADEIARLEPMLQPIAKLVDVFVDVMDSMTDLGESPEDNIEMMRMIVRSAMETPTAPEGALPIFEAFGIEIIVEGPRSPKKQLSLQEQEEKNIQAAMMASMNSFEKYKQRSHQDDDGPALKKQKTSVTASCSSEPHVKRNDSKWDVAPEPSRPWLGDANVAPPGQTVLVDEAYSTQIAIIQQEMLSALARWITTFPAYPGKRTWPSGFNTQEQLQLRQFVRAYIDDRAHGIGTKIEHHPPQKVADMITRLLTLECPVADAKNSTILGQVFREEYPKAHRQRLRLNISDWPGEQDVGKRKAEEENDEENSAPKDEHSSKPQSKKRRRS
nr:hypothetical protein CFP56_73994 [Quercus suber]